MWCIKEQINWKQSVTVLSQLRIDFIQNKAQDYSNISNSNLINYKKLLQSQISTIKAVDIFDTSTRYTILADPSTVFSSENTGKSSPKRKPTSAHGEYRWKFGEKTQKSVKSRQPSRSGILKRK